MDQKIRKSFQAVKKDINEIKEEIKEISLNIAKSKIEKKETNKIYTSKVFVDDSLMEAVNEVFSSGIFTSGKKTKEFEKKFAEFTGVKHAVAISNGTVAIEVALQALRIKKGDEIIVPSHTTMPTIEPVLRLGAKPIFVDICKATYTINPEKIKKALTKKTKAIICVHIYGNPANLNEIKKICEKNKLYLIEDCAQAHNAKYHGQHVGTIGDVGCFSFYPTKNLTVCGEGGMIVTNNDKVNEISRMLINHGENPNKRYDHVLLGNNHRLSEIHCAIGIKQLELLENFTKRRREIAMLYNQFLKSSQIILPSEEKNSEHCYHLYVIRVDSKKRDKIIEELKKEEIYLGIHYPVPCHMQPVIKKMFRKKFILPITEKISKEIISLPIYPELSDEQVEMICEKIKNLV